MRLLSWNCRGLGRSLTVRGLKNLVRRCSPFCVFLMKTKVDKLRIQGIGSALGFKNSFAMDRGSGCEGLAFLRHSDVCCNVFYYSDWCLGIDIIAKDGFCWSIWLCHCPNKRTDRHLFWDNLRVTISRGRDN